MVNTESFDTFTPSPRLRQALAASAGALVSRIGNSINDIDGLDSLSRLSNLSNLESTLDLTAVLRDVETLLGTTLVSDFSLVIGFQTHLEALEGLSQRVQGILGRRARRFLNAVTTLPPLASEAVSLTEQVAACSLSGGALSGLLQNHWSGILRSAEKKLASLQECEGLRLSELESFLAHDERVMLGFFVHLMCGTAENLGTVVSRMAEFSQGSYAPSAFLGEHVRDMATVERRAHSARHLTQVVERLARGDAWRKARGALVAGQTVESLLWLDAGLQDLESGLGALSQLEPAGLEAPQRSLEAENFLYVRALARRLILAGEAPREVEKLADALFDYALRNAVSCAEIIDEEVAGLQPTVRRDSLVKARLEVRLNDRGFPLSVAHKDWIQNAIKDL